MVETNYRNKLIVKSNDLIESKYHLSVREQKFIIFLASLVDRNTTHLDKTKVKIKEIEAALKGSNDKKWGSIYDVVKEVVLSINTKPLKIKKPGGGGWIIINWFSTVDADTEQGVITFELSKTIKAQLLQLNEYFTRYRFGNILSLKSGYSIRIYELLKLNQFKGKARYELSHFRELIGVSYETENKEWIHKYEEYKIFKNRVIRHAQKELKRETDIYFEIQEEREGRSVKYITFYMFENKVEKSTLQPELFSEPKPETSIDDENYPYSQDIINDFVEIGFSLKKAKSLYRKGFNIIQDDKVRKEIVDAGRSLDEYFLEKIHYTNYMIGKGDVTNPPGLLLSAIKQNYISKSVQKDKKKQVAKKKKQKAENFRLEQEEKLLEMSRALTEKENRIIRKLIDGADNFLDELFEEEHPELWRGYDKAQTLKENYIASSGALKARFDSKIKDQNEKAFESLKSEVLKVEKFRKQVSLL